MTTKVRGIHVAASRVESSLTSKVTKLLLPSPMFVRKTVAGEHNI